jgi:excisionase family DNA binding protein
VIVAELSPSDRHLLGIAVDMLARRLRADGAPLPTALRQLRELLAETDLSRHQPTNLHPAGHGVDDATVLLDLDEVADRLRIHRRTVERRIAAGELPTVTIGRARRVRPVDLATYIAAMRPDVVAGG